MSQQRNFIIPKALYVKGSTLMMYVASGNLLVVADKKRNRK